MVFASRGRARTHVAFVKLGAGISQEGAQAPVACAAIVSGLRCRLRTITLKRMEKAACTFSCSTLVYRTLLCHAYEIAIWMAALENVSKPV